MNFDKDFLVDLLEENEFETTEDNIELLDEQLSNGQTIILDSTSDMFESDNEDYALMQVLDKNGFMVTDHNLAVLKEALENGHVLFEADNMKSLGQAVGDVAKGDISSGKQKSAEELFSERQKENEAEEAADFDKKHPNLSRMTKDYEKSGDKITSRDSKHGSFKVKSSDGHTHYVYHSTNGGYSKQEADGTGKIVSHLHSSDGKAWK